MCFGLFGLTLLCCAVAGLRADEAPPPQPPPPGPAGAPPDGGSSVPAPGDKPLDLHFLDFLVPKHPRPTWRVGAATDFAATAGIDGSRATVNVTGLEGSVGYEGWRLRYKRSIFAWNLHDSAVFPSDPAPEGARRDPWQDLNTIGLAWFHFAVLKPHWTYILAAGVNAAYEKEVKDCFNAFAMGMYGYSWRPGWQFNFGAILAVNRIHVIPLPAVSWSYRKDAQDGWSFQIGIPEFWLAYHFDSRWQVSSHFIEFEGETWRLADDNPVAHGGYLEAKGVKTGLDVQYKPTDRVTFTLAGKYVFNRQWIVQSSTLKHKETIDLHPALGGQLQVEWNF